MRFEGRRDLSPVEMCEKSLNVGFSVCIGHQIGMLPHVNTDDRCALHKGNTMHQCVILIVSLSDYELLVFS